MRPALLKRPGARPTRDERGAIGVLFGVLLGTGVLFGSVALAFDYGMLNANHSQLQSSADAAALKAARTCATSIDGSCPAPGALTGIANANDGGSPHSSSVLALCGRDPAAGLPSCDNLDDNITQCPQSSWPGTYVEIHATKQTDEIFTNNGRGGSDQGEACAAVAWGVAHSITTTLPFTVSVCEFSRAVGAVPPAAGTYPSANVAFALNYKNGTACAGWNGHDFPGGFGWLDAEIGCHAQVRTGDWVSVNPGMGKAGGNQNECDDKISAAIGTTVYLPVFDCVSKTDTFCDSSASGTNTDYHLLGLAAFVMDGFNSPGYQGNTGSTDGLSCPGTSKACLYGHFVRGVAPIGSIDTSGNDPDLGLQSLQTIG